MSAHGSIPTRSREVADTIYTYVNDRVIAEKLKDDIEEKENLDNKEASEKTEGEA